jgi:hypothetical protein
MSSDFEKCPNCGAPLEASADPRAVRCGYCGAAETRRVDAARLAASLRAESASNEELFESLSRRFSVEFPRLTHLETKGGLLSAKRVVSFELQLGDSVFRMRRSGAHQIVAERAEVVRGITVKTEVVPLETWIGKLSEALSELATSSASTKDGLRRLTGG